MKKWFNTRIIYALGFETKKKYRSLCILLRGTVGKNIALCRKIYFNTKLQLTSRLFHIYFEQPLQEN